MNSVIPSTRHRAGRAIVAALCVVPALALSMPGQAGAATLTPQQAIQRIPKHVPAPVQKIDRSLCHQMRDALAHDMQATPQQRAVAAKATDDDCAVGGSIDTAPTKASLAANTTGPPLLAMNPCDGAPVTMDCWNFWNPGISGVLCGYYHDGMGNYIGGLLAAGVEEQSELCFSGFISNDGTVWGGPGAGMPRPTCWPDSIPGFSAAFTNPPLSGYGWCGIDHSGGHDLDTGANWAGWAWQVIPFVQPCRHGEWWRDWIDSSGIPYWSQGGYMSSPNACN